MSNTAPDTTTVTVGEGQKDGWLQTPQNIEAPTKKETDALEVEVVDDTPEKDRNKPKRDPKAPPVEVTDEELAKYTADPQKRIKQLRYEYHEERRQKEAAQREKEAALQAALHWQQQAVQYQSQGQQRQAEYVDQMRLKTQTEIQLAQKNLASAIEAGKSDDTAAAQMALSRAVAQAEMLGPVPNRQQVQPQQQAPQQQPQWQPARQQAPQQPAADPKAVNWLKANPWFGTDEPMTGYAYGLHEKLVKAGVHPASDEYYQKIDAGLHKVFPDEFGDQGQQAAPRPNIVAAPARGSAPRKVQLTASQAAVAKRLGLTLEQYATQLVKEQANG